MHQILTKDTLRIVATTYLNRSPKRTGSIILERDKSTCLVTRKPSMWSPSLQSAVESLGVPLQLNSTLDLIGDRGFSSCK